MGMCVDGVWWIVLPNIPEMEEAAENAEEEKDLKLGMGIRIFNSSRKLFLIWKLFTSKDGLKVREKKALVTLAKCKLMH